MRIYQFENSNQNHDKDVVLMFLIGYNDLNNPATSLIIRDNENEIFDWGYHWEWVTKRSTRHYIVNSFKFRNDL